MNWNLAVMWTFRLWVNGDKHYSSLRAESCSTGIAWWQRLDCTCPLSFFHISPVLLSRLFHCLQTYLDKSLLPSYFNLKNRRSIKFTVWILRIETVRCSMKYWRKPFAGHQADLVCDSMVPFFSHSYSCTVIRGNLWIPFPNEALSQFCYSMSTFTASEAVASKKTRL